MEADAGLGSGRVMDNCMLLEKMEAEAGLGTEREMDNCEDLRKSFSRKSPHVIVDVHRMIRIRSSFHAEKRSTVFNEEWRVNKLTPDWTWSDVWESTTEWESANVEQMSLQEKDVVPKMISDIHSKKVDRQLEGVKQIMMLIARMLNFARYSSNAFEYYQPLLDKITKADVVPTFLNFMRGSNKSLQAYSMNVLNNLICANPRYAKLVIDANGIPVILNFLSTPITNEIKESALLLLGNLSLHSEARDQILYGKEPFNFIPLSEEGPAIASLLVWIFYNISRDPIPPPEQMRPILIILYNLIKKFINELDEVIPVEACNVLAYISGAPGETIQGMVDVGLVPNLAKLLVPNLLPSQALAPALRIIGNIVISDTDQIKIVLDNNIFKNLSIILKLHSGDKNILQEACWVLSSIIAGDRCQIMEIDKDVIIHLIWLAAEFKPYIWEAVYVISFAAASGSYELIECLVENNFIELISMLVLKAPEDLTLIMLEGLYHVFNVGDDTLEGPNENIERFTLCGGWEGIHSLQSKEMGDISMTANEMFERYWVPQFENMYKGCNSDS